MDNPGFGEGEDCDAISRLAKTSLNTSSAYVYIVHYDELGNDDDARAYKRMFEKDKGLDSYTFIIML